jgi:hypothetical protein
LLAVSVAGAIVGATGTALAARRPAEALVAQRGTGQ